MRSGRALLLLALACSGGEDASEHPFAGQSRDSDACVFRGPYSLRITLTDGESGQLYAASPSGPGTIDPVQGCAAGSNGAAVIQTMDSASCSIVACLENSCAELVCTPGDPVTECSITSSSKSGVGAYQCVCSDSSMVFGCGLGCFTELTCAYEWRITPSL